MRSKSKSFFIEGIVAESFATSRLVGGAPTILQISPGQAPELRQTATRAPCLWRVQSEERRRRGIRQSRPALVRFPRRFRPRFPAHLQAEARSRVGIER